MKKVILASVAVAAIATVVTTEVQAVGTIVCSQGTVTAITVTAGATSFVKTSFTPKCSNNTFVSAEDNNTYYRVGGASAKGKYPFYGSTMGGGVVPSTTSCAATGCLSSDAQAAVLLGASS